MAISKYEFARNPASHLRVADDVSLRVMQDATVAGQGSAPARGDDVAERGYPIA
jgi:hypothetical protein